MLVHNFICLSVVCFQIQILIQMALVCLVFENREIENRRKGKPNPNPFSKPTQTPGQLSPACFLFHAGPTHTLSRGPVCFPFPARASLPHQSNARPGLRLPSSPPRSIHSARETNAPHGPLPESRPRSRVVLGPNPAQARTPAQPTPRPSATRARPLSLTASAPPIGAILHAPLLPLTRQPHASATVARSESARSVPPVSTILPPSFSAPRNSHTRNHRRARRGSPSPNRARDPGSSL